MAGLVRNSVPPGPILAFENGHLVQAISVSINSDIVWNESAFTKMILGSRPENPDVIDSVYLRNNIQINI